LARDISMVPGYQDLFGANSQLVRYAEDLFSNRFGTTPLPPTNQCCPSQGCGNSGSGSGSGTGVGGTNNRCGGFYGQLRTGTCPHAANTINR
jgi:hypothetical protein